MPEFKLCLLPSGVGGNSQGLCSGRLLWICCGFTIILQYSGLKVHSEFCVRYLLAGVASGSGLGFQPKKLDEDIYPKPRKSFCVPAWLTLHISTGDSLTLKCCSQVNMKGPACPAAQGLECQAEVDCNIKGLVREYLDSMTSGSDDMGPTQLALAFGTVCLASHVLSAYFTITAKNQTDLNMHTCTATTRILCPRPSICDYVYVHAHLRNPVFPPCTIPSPQSLHPTMLS